MMSRGRLIGYLIAGMIFLSIFSLVAVTFFPAFRNGGDTLAGIIIAQFVAAIIGLGAKEIVESETKKRADE